MSLINVWTGRTLPLFFIVVLTFLSHQSIAKEDWTLVGLDVVAIALNLDTAFFWWIKINAKGKLRKK